MASKAIVSFIKGIEGDEVSAEYDQMQAETEDLLKPLVEAMELEGSYAMKDPCYDNTLVSRDDPKCLKGSPWTVEAQKIMAGDIEHL